MLPNERGGSALQVLPAFSEKLTYHLINATGRALTSAAIKGGSLEDALKSALVGIVADLMPIVDDAKAFHEAKDPLDYTLAVVGAWARVVMVRRRLSGVQGSASGGSFCQGGTVVLGLRVAPEIESS